MRIVGIVGIGIMLMLQSCLTTSKKAGQSHVESSPNFPYRAFSKSVLNKNTPPLDTTFDYGILERPLYGALPKNIFSSNVMGSVEFYAMIDAKKHVVDIKVIQCEFYRKKNLVYRYDEHEGIEVNSQLKNYLLVFMQGKPFKQNKDVTLQQHPTYCFIGFYK